MPWNPFGPRSRPKNFGSGTGEPVEPPPQVVLVKPKFSIATAPARVTTARDTPRTRTAETAVMTPDDDGDRDARQGAEREGDAEVDGHVR